MNTIFDTTRYIIALIVIIFGINNIVSYLEWLNEKWNFEIARNQYEEEMRKVSLDILNRLNKKLD